MKKEKEDMKAESDPRPYTLIPRPWHYCVLTDLTTINGAIMAPAKFAVFTTDESQSWTEIHNPIAQTIARLGQQGWELTAAVQTTGLKHNLYFKRPAPI